MAIAATLKQYLDLHHSDYELVPHPRTYTSMRTAEAAHLSGDHIAKSVVVGDGRHYALMVLPATHRLALHRVPAPSDRRMRLASEAEFAHLFSDCEIGSIPACGAAYGLTTWVDDALLEQDEVYFESGNHEELVHMSGEQFRELMDEAGHGELSRHR